MGPITRTLDEMKRFGLGFARTAFPHLPLVDKSFIAGVVQAVTLPLWGLHKAVEDTVNDIIPQPKSSRDALSTWAATLGIPNGAGGYGRAVAVAASGGAATLTGTLGTIYPANGTATSEDGTVQIKLSGAVTIPGSGTGFGSIPGKFTAVTVGSIGNLPAGTVFLWDNTPSGADDQFTLTSALGSGDDEESNPDLYARIIARLQTPPRGGVAEDYRLWIGTVSGLASSFVYGKRSGTGTVDVVIVTGGTGQGRVPSAAQLDAAQVALNANVPENAESAKALLPYAPDGRGHVVLVKVTPASADFDFDWDDTAGPYTVDLYSVGPPSTLRLQTLAPATLKAQIDAYNLGTGDPPRIQVISTGAVINPGVGVVAWSDGGGKTTLTLDTLPTGFVAPTIADNVFAYGPVVATIAAGTLALCDALGPSRSSGYADDITRWRDKLTISSIGAVAENAIDTFGNKLIDEVPPGDVTIDAVAADVQGTDGINGPELLYLKSVAVVQA